MLRTFIQFTSITATFIATFFWIRGAIQLSIKDLATLGMTFYGSNPATLKIWASQKADSLVAGLLLCLSFILQTGNFLWQMRIMDFGVDYRGVGISAVVSIVLFLACYWGSSRLTNFYLLKAKTLMAAK